MKNKRTLLAASLLFIVTLSADATAQSGHGAHIHGVGTLNAIRDQGTISMIINLPGADVVGFEHEAESDVDIRTVRKAFATLGDLSQVLVIPTAAGCTVNGAEVMTSLLHDKNYHEHEHEHEHKHKHGHEKEHRDGHGGFEAHYELKCGSPDKLENIVINLFSLFPSLHKIDAVLITGSRQTAKTLTPVENTISLAK